MRQTAVAIIVTDNGRVENRLFNVPEGFTASDIEKMVNILNERLIGTPLSPYSEDTCPGNENGVGTSYSPCRRTCSLPSNMRFQSNRKNVCISAVK